MRVMQSLFSTGAIMYFRSMYDLIVILGPTASGKTRLAAQLARRLGTEVISADSRQVFRYIDIGTGKDLDDYIVNGERVPYHLIDITDARSAYNLHHYQLDFQKAYDEITSCGKIPVLCGGTGLYIDAVLKGYDYAAVPVDEALRTS